MKTPEEIKKGLYACPDELCHMCPYEPEGDCMSDCMSDALAYIQQLESRLAQVERERDAAVSDCSRFPCSTCSKKTCHNCNVRKDTTRTGYEWRGVCKENTKEDAQE